MVKKSITQNAWLLGIPDVEINMPEEFNSSLGDKKKENYGFAMKSFDTKNIVVIGIEAR